MGFIVETSFFGNFKQTEDPKVLIIPVPYEYTALYVKGTKNGPQAILNASVYLNSFDDELWLEPSIVGINTTNFVNCEFVNNKSKSPFNELEQVVRSAIIAGSLPVVIGGEQSISYGSIKAVYDLYPDVSVLYFSAALNSKNIFQNNKFNSACTFRRVSEVMTDFKIVQVGGRSISSEESAWLDNTNPSFEIFFAKDKNRWNAAEILSNLSKNIYISFNFDVLDPSVMPSVSKPEPGGLTYEQVLDIIKNICVFKDIIGMDFVGLTPISSLAAPDFLASKLIYKIIGYTFARQLGVFEENKESPLVASEP